MGYEQLRGVVADKWDDLVTAASAPPADVWITRPELAARWKMPVATLNQWASQRKGPRYALFGRHARYHIDDVIAWETAQFAQQG